MNFFDRLADGIEEKDSVVCVGLDPVRERIPGDLSVLEFNRRIIDATSEVAVAYKPNSAFYEATDDWDVLRQTAEYVHEETDAEVVLDAKRGDIGNSSSRYADLLDFADAITVSPYMGHDSIEPFIERPDKGVFVLCKTTNDGSSDFQDIDCGGKPLYAEVAERCADWDLNSNLGLVVGATYPETMEEVRRHADDLPFLVPGVGAQGGSLRAAVEHGLSSEGVGVVNSTRSIIYAGEEDEERFDDEARKAARDLRDSLNEYR
ncbi:MAG: orotidine-5'-phosphate decarboxylase [Halobacteria archaeon]|nr:orotidine-5'-phosphate decarboxylase [Halobacteria archaeon]